ncbi:hypothetical protein Y032_0009g443 [Ancylostoma ceylanicum]|uniref:Uncharacterized protein n=1 Tax=Ancylostoma ceylanicum TaxID=53326 RepID=A0A016VH35_9BILA|nr:hypothetical protein Y032_0009g443 [Ancylostoma ceylanicum]
MYFNYGVADTCTTPTVFTVHYIISTVGVDDGDPPAASKSTWRDRAAPAGILFGTSNYGVFLILIIKAQYTILKSNNWRDRANVEQKLKKNWFRIEYFTALVPQPYLGFFY